MFTSVRRVSSEDTSTIIEAFLTVRRNIGGEQCAYSQVGERRYVAASFENGAEVSFFNPQRCSALFRTDDAGQNSLVRKLYRNDSTPRDVGEQKFGVIRVIDVPCHEHVWNAGGRFGPIVRHRLPCVRIKTGEFQRFVCRLEREFFR